MGKRDNNYFLNLLKSMRIYRSLIPLSFIILVVGFANQLSKEIIILCISCVLLYVSGGVFNAKIDKDFKIKYVNIFLFLIFITTLILSFSNIIIFAAVLSWIFLNIIYSKYSRFVLFGDTIILGFTHVMIPILSASLLLNLDYTVTIKLASFMFFSMILIMPIKNIKGIDEDKKRGYKTFLTTYRKGKQITIVLMFMYFTSLFMAYYVFDLGNKFLLLSIFFIPLYMVMHMCMIKKMETLSYKCSRLLVLFFLFAIVFDQTSRVDFVALSAFPILVYLPHLLTKN
ncbi:MAG: UbiA prenyltransferase family protein [Nanoarchaeota archaeon]|nr:UbiA prenyltransferase family protein [Nanoarchaeota archaeon]